VPVGLRRGHATALRALPDPWLVDVVPAYTTVAIYFDLDQITYAPVAEAVRGLLDSGPAEGNVGPGRLHRIPCCYEMELDLGRVGRRTGLPAEEVFRLHIASGYTVYAIGFCPGFPYLGYLPAPLCGGSMTRRPFSSFPSENSLSAPADTPLTSA